MMSDRGETAFPFRKAHLGVLLFLLLAFTGLTLFVVLHMSPGDWNDWRRPHPYLATALTFCGPFTAAILRPFEPYGWKLALGFFPFCIIFPLGGAAFQFLPLPFRRGALTIRLIAWTLGLLGWFVGGFLCLVCSLE